MGLDSVELLVETEKFFGINIPGTEAETITTLQKMTDVIAGHLHISDHSTALKRKVYDKVCQALVTLGFTDVPAGLDSPFFKCLDPRDRTSLQALEDELQWKLCRPFMGRKNLFSYFTSGYDWQTITTGQFIDALCAENHNVLIPGGKPQNTYEIYILVMVLTADKTGCDFYELGPDISFTNDLGID